MSENIRPISVDAIPMLDLRIAEQSGAEDNSASLSIFSQLRRYGAMGLSAAVAAGGLVAAERVGDTPAYAVESTLAIEDSGAFPSAHEAQAPYSGSAAGYKYVAADCFEAPPLPLSNTDLYNQLAVQRASDIAAFNKDEYPANAKDYYLAPCVGDYEQEFANAAQQSNYPDINKVKIRIKKAKNGSIKISGTLTEEGTRAQMPDSVLQNPKNLNAAIEKDLSVDGSVLTDQSIRYGLAVKARKGQKITPLTRTRRKFVSKAAPVIEQPDPNHRPSDPEQKMNFKIKRHISAGKINRLIKGHRLFFYAEKQSDDVHNYDPSGEAGGTVLGSAYQLLKKHGTITYIRGGAYKNGRVRTYTYRNKHQPQTPPITH
jgi:hypothetical protein